MVTNDQRQTAAVRYSKEAKCADLGARDTARDGTMGDRRKDETIEKKQRRTKEKVRVHATFQQVFCDEMSGDLDGVGFVSSFSSSGSGVRLYASPAHQ